MKRFTPQQLVIGLGVGHRPLHGRLRHRRRGITGSTRSRRSTGRCSATSRTPVKVAFYTVIPVLLVLRRGAASPPGAELAAGRPDDRSTNAENIKRRMGDFRAGVYMQTLLRDPAAGIMHSLIYFGFLVLAAVTAVLEIDHQLPEDAEVPPRRHVPGLLVRGRRRRPRLPGRRRCGPSCAATCIRPYRIRIKSKPEHALILGLFALLGRHRLHRRGVPHRHRRRRPQFEEWAFVGYPLSSLVDGHGQPRRLAPGHVGGPRRRASSPSWRSCR